MQAGHQRTFETLDALRGLAAVAVFQCHFVAIYGGPHFAPHGYLAVDFFFGLSGFVLCHAYQGRLDKGLSTPAFLKTRLIRLYPMYLIGVLLGVFSVLRMRALNSWPVSPGVLTVFFAYALFFFPAIPGTSGFITVSFPFDMPAWSLFSELMANFAHAMFLRRRSGRILLAAVAIAALVLVISGLIKGSADFGVEQTDTWFGLARVAFSYLSGICIYRFWAGREWRPISSLVPACLLILLLIVPVRPVLEPLYDLTVILLAFPALVLCGALARDAQRWRGITSLLGTTSYALYVLHVPLLFFMNSAWRHVTHRTLAMAPVAGQVCSLLVIGTIAIALDAYYDLPARRWMRLHLLSRSGTERIA